MRNVFVLGIAVAGLLACSSEGDGEIIDPAGASSGNNNASSSSSGQPEGPKSCRDTMTNYTGLGSKALAAGRVDGKQDDKQNTVVIDRHRVKPFQVLVDDMHRILGTANQANMDTLITGSADAFGAPPNRWFAEPQASAVTLFTTYRIAFRGCLQYANTVPAWTQQPNATTAAAECATLAAKVWDTVPSKAEIDACVAVATDETEFAKVPAPTGPVTDAKTKWAYACASVFESNKFTSF
ncbi:MAG: hypothetical protein HOO96_31560 [Polyangiaceae bacterium]|nr:hypothetical protein [Polyangiaceae bacterium]